MARWCKILGWGYDNPRHTYTFELQANLLLFKSETHIHIQTYMHTYTHIHTEIHRYTHTDMHTAIHAFIHTYADIQSCNACMHTYMHRYINIHR
jgi:hypothetical protein